ncbi:MAG: hypothetical protein ONB43_06765 [candidate division KSB1 bacterium]|nr:hypothetical protein [candidate division KSB1 bacterium]
MAGRIFAWLNLVAVIVNVVLGAQPFLIGIGTHLQAKVFLAFAAPLASPKTSQLVKNFQLPFRQFVNERRKLFLSMVLLIMYSPG